MEHSFHADVAKMIEDSRPHLASVSQPVWDNSGVAGTVVVRLKGMASDGAGEGDEFSVELRPDLGASCEREGKAIAAGSLHELLMQISPAYGQSYLAAVAAKLLAARAEESEEDEGDGES